MSPRALFLTLLLATVASSCAGPSVWHPVKLSSDAKYPRQPDSYRVPEASRGCDLLGTVDAETLETLSAVVAKHGGTHYVVESDRRNETERPDLPITAKAYYCP